MSLLATSFATSEGAARYVDESAGSDDNPGTQASPWRHCPAMLGWTGSASLNPGDIVYFDRSDTWTLGENLGGPGLDLKAGVHYIGNAWDPEGLGSGRAILRATGLHESGVVRILEDHASLPTWIEGFEIDANDQRANLVDINHSHWRTGLINAVKRVENCVAHGNTGNGDQGDYLYGIIISDNSPDASGRVANVEILNTIVHDVARDGICLYPGNNGRISNILVRGCEVYNTARDPSYTEGHGVLLKGDVRDSVIEYCYSHGVNSSAVFINGPENGTGPGPSNCIVRHNVLQTVDNNGVIRFYGTGTKSVDIIGNIMLQNEQLGGLSFAGNSGTIAARIYNNTFFNSFVDIGNPSSTGTIDFRNNIIYELDDVPLVDSGGDITSHANNLFFRSGGGTLVSVPGNSYNAATLATWESSALSSDPAFTNTADLPNGFVSPAAGVLVPNHPGLAPRFSSVALNSGQDSGAAYQTSINGVQRPVNSGWDRGAYEGPPPPTVMTAMPLFTKGTSCSAAWAAAAGATDYDVQIATSADFSSPIATQNSMGLSSIFSGLSNGAKYYYRVRSNAYSTSSNWSNAVSTTQDAVAPALAVLIPAPGIAYSTTHATIGVNGTASDALSGLSSVRVAGHLAATGDGFATWSDTVTLAIGANPVSAVAADNAQPGGNTTSAFIDVTRYANAQGDGLPDPWKLANGLDPNSSSAANGPMGDPDRDGRVNLLEHALNTGAQLHDPDPCNAAIVTNPGDGLKYLHFSYPRRIGALDLKYTVEISTDLSSWAAPSSQIEVLGAVPDGGGITETVSVRIKPEITLGTRRFVHLRVELQ